MLKITPKLIVTVASGILGGIMTFKVTKKTLFDEPKEWEFDPDIDEDDLIDEIFPDEESENKEAEAKAEA